MKNDNFFLFISSAIFLFSLFLLINNFYSLVSLSTGNVMSTVNLTVEEVLLVNFTVDSIDWGTGSVNANASFAVLDSLGNVTNGNWDEVDSGFVIENLGNINLSMNFSSLKNAENFIGGTNPSYQYMVSDIDAGACTPPAGFSLGSFYEFPGAGTSVLICDNFAAGRSIKFNLNLSIPYNSKIGNLTDIISVSIEESD